MPEDIEIGGARVITLTAPPPVAPGPCFLNAQILPGRAMMLLQARADVPGLGEIDLIASPPLEEAARKLSGGTGDEFGNAAFAFGGAVLAPFANRIRGEVQEGAVRTRIAGKAVRLPANWGGKAPGAEQYAMHGLTLDKPAERLTYGPEDARGVLARTDFGGQWPGELEISVEWRLGARRLTLVVTAENVGGEATPVGIGWHPYFALPSGRREQARLTIPAKSRALINNYDEVLPTGEAEPVAGTDFDFRRGKALGELYLDDCFLDLGRNENGEIEIDIADPAAGLLIRVTSPSPQVQAVQTYAPPDKPFVVVEPQFNLANPYGQEWRGRDTGMVTLQPGERTVYEASIELLAYEPRHG